MSRKRSSIRRPSEARRSNHPQRAKSGKRSGSSISTPRPAHKPARSPDLSRFRSPLGPVDPYKLARDTRTRVVNALGEWRDNPKLSFSEVAKRWHLDTRSFHKYGKQALRTTQTGRVKPLPNDPIRETLYIPSTKPGEYQDIVTRSRQERQILGEWWAAFNEFRAGKFARIDAFPKNTFIDGVRLPTSHYEIQQIADALAQEDSKFAGPYRVSGRAA
jgi:hypothetical protein